MQVPWQLALGCFCPCSSGWNGYLGGLKAIPTDNAFMVMVLDEAKDTARAVLVRAEDYEAVEQKAVAQLKAENGLSDLDDEAAGFKSRCLVRSRAVGRVPAQDGTARAWRLIQSHGTPWSAPLAICHFRPIPWAGRCG